LKRAKLARIIPFPQRSDPDVPLLSAKQAAPILGVNEKTLRRLAGEGKVPGFRLDPPDSRSEWRFDEAVLLSYTKTRCWANLKEPLRSQIDEERAKFQASRSIGKTIIDANPPSISLPRTKSG